MHTEEHTERAGRKERFVTRDSGGHLEVSQGTSPCWVPTVLVQRLLLVRYEGPAALVVCSVAIQQQEKALDAIVRERRDGISNRRHIIEVIRIPGTNEALHTLWGLCESFDICS